MTKKFSQSHIAVFLLSVSMIFGIWLFTLESDFLWYWLFGLGFGFLLQHFMICFVSTTSDPIILGSTERFRAILIGILATSAGFAAIKYLSGGILDMLGVSAISIPLMLGAFLFGMGMTLAGCCSSGMFIRMAEGYSIHIITLLCVIVGYLFASTQYKSLWAPFVAKAPLVFLPDKFGWTGGIAIHISIILILYVAARKYEQRVFPSDNSVYLKGALLLAFLNVVHILVLKSGWSVTGAFFWIGEFLNTLSDNSSVLTGNKTLFVTAFGPMLRNLGLFFGALISVLLSKRFRIKKIRSKKQIAKSIVGGLLMGYGACIAGGCNISAFFVSASALSLSAWIFMIFLFAGTFAGIKVLYKLM